MIEVGAAIVEDEAGRLLIARRREGKSQAGLWEFPGGKLEPGETAQACIARELREEMNIEVEPGAILGENEHDYANGSIRLIAVRAAYISGEIQLTDHDLCEWVEPGRLSQYLFAPADMKFVEMLMRIDSIGGARDREVLE
ncbi:(deoxy)nucleoside triphosphate pyrophosphohydrolase [Cohnella lubricantis]|uniref:8-oxo-dGTP diphosphatase n=1 Tax=Cohnella lubricantis TaxID=2163172 RepID=A0A841TH69_9BACL|nr:(deoxy)nucleoside triphosphate pyrophosphohydrolase [Cohnella lubricantis]MBB6678598.1 (deoxy)nucleoside triphosphate pyrophosphohydrolase [Cohnella lubricantis]MBP2119245.1 8-oxo-dGTP diphosphatase [Cohnella lubricantis]